MVVEPVSRGALHQGRVLVASLLAVAVFALLVSFVSASQWRIDADMKLLAALGGTMFNLVTGAAVFAAVGVRRTSARLRFLDEDLARHEPQDAARTGEDREHDAQVE